MSITVISAVTIAMLNTDEVCPLTVCNQIEEAGN